MDRLNLLGLFRAALLFLDRTKAGQVVLRKKFRSNFGK
jgi:hypothetical protein